MYWPVYEYSIYFNPKIHQKSTLQGCFFGGQKWFGCRIIRQSAKDTARPQKVQFLQRLKKRRQCERFGICTRLLSRKPTEAIPNAEGRRAVESNAYIMVTNPSSPTTSRRALLACRDLLYKTICKSRLRFTGCRSFSPKMRAFLGTP